MLTKSIQKELNSFFAKLSGKDYSILEVTKGALTQARAKLKPDAFVELSDLAVSEFYENEAFRTWKGFRLLAIDGSTSHLPMHPSIKEDFGSQMVGCKGNVETSIARTSLFYDVLNCITLSAQIDSHSVSENTLLNKHLALDKFSQTDMVLLDRGYSSNALMYELHHKGVGYCMRMRSSWKQVREFADSGEQSRIVVFHLARKDRKLQEKYCSDTDYVTCRLVAITLDTGEKEILCTSLLDEQEYTLEDMKALYHFRWNIEEAYKLLKVRMQLSNYSGKTSNSVRQDFFAKLFMMNMCAIMSFPIEEKVRQENQVNNLEHPKQVNKTNAISTLKKAWSTLWLKRKSREILTAFDEILLKTKEIVRKDRKFERKKYRYPDKKPSPPYKSI